VKPDSLPVAFKLAADTQPVGCRNEAGTINLTKKKPPTPEGLAVSFFY